MRMPKPSVTWNCLKLQRNEATDVDRQNISSLYSAVRRFSDGAKDRHKKILILLIGIQKTPIRRVVIITTANTIILCRL